MTRLITGSRTVRGSSYGKPKSRVRPSNPTANTVIPTKTIEPRRELVKVVPNLENNPISRTLWRGPEMRGARNTDQLHVSHILSNCVRQKALGKVLKVPLPSQTLWDRQGVTFAIGNAVGDFVVEKMMRADNRVFGTWGCACKATTIEAMQTFAADHKCNECGTGCTNYLELHLKAEDYMLQGHCDLALAWGDKLYLVEVKSTNEKGANDVKNKAKMDHIIQLVFYMWMAKRAGMAVHDTASILYVKKEWGMGSPYIEHVIDYNEKVHLLDPYLEEAVEYYEFWQSGVLPSRKVCSTMEDNKAKGCMFCHECFARP
jgi:hypothetical protein